MRRSFPLRRPRFFVVIFGTTAILAAMAPPSGAEPPHCGRLQQSLWACRYDGPGHYIDNAFAVDVSPDGSVVYVTGSSSATNFRDDYATAAYAAGTGQLLWLSRYDGPADSVDSAADVGVTPDGSVVLVTGSSYDGTNDDFATIAYDATTGRQLWVARYPLGQARALDPSPDGSMVLVTGWSGDPAQATTIAYAASSGDKLWVSMYRGPGSFDDPKDIEVSPDGSRVFVTAMSLGSTSNDFATIGYDATTGDQLWVARYDGPGSGEDTVYGLAVSPDGSMVFVTGTDYSLQTYQDFATIAYDAGTGDQLWIAHFGSGRNNLDVAVAIRASPDGSAVFVTGYTVGDGGLDYATIAYDPATGDQLWISGYNRGYDLPSALAVSPDGSTVYVTGYSLWQGGYDYATVAYDTAAGAHIWTSRTAVEGDEFPEDIAVSPDGSNVFVTGRANLALFRTSDYLTVAYPG